MKNQGTLIKKLPRLLLVLVGVAVFCHFIFEPSKAQSVTSAPKVESLRDVNFNKLIESAETTGSVRVIGGFHFEFTPTQSEPQGETISATITG